MKVAILGSGNGGCATAFEWAQAGHDVYLFDFERFGKQISLINKNGGIKCSGEMSGFVKLAYAGHDLEKCVTDADLIIVVGPAYSTEAFGLACKPFVKAGQKYVINPSSCMGTIVFKNALGLAIDDYSVTISDFSTLPYAVRILEDGSLAIYNHLPAGCKMATLPSSRNDEMYEILKPVHCCLEKAKNILETCLQNANPVIHPCITTLNVARVEAPEDFFFYEQGVTPGVGKLLKAIDEERIEIGKKFGVNIEADPAISVRQGYFIVDTYDTGYITAPGFKGIKAQTQLDYRYYNEDAGYGLVLWLDMADRLGLEVPTMRAMVQIVSAIMERDYRAEKARTFETLGLDKYSVEELIAIL